MARHLNTIKKLLNSLLSEKLFLV